MGSHLLEKSARKFKVKVLGPVFTVTASERGMHYEWTRRPAVYLTFHEMGNFHTRRALPSQHP